MEIFSVTALMLCAITILIVAYRIKPMHFSDFGCFFARRHFHRLQKTVLWIGWSFIFVSLALIGPDLLYKYVLGFVLAILALIIAAIPIAALITLEVMLIVWIFFKLHGRQNGK